jgi:hypothetical protein
MATTIETSWTDKDAVTGRLARKAFAFGACLGTTAKAVKASGSSEAGAGEAGWDDLTVLMDATRFRRTAADGVAQDWPAYRDLLLTARAPQGFRKQINRISEAGNRVFMELTEYETAEDGTEKVVNICTVHAFDDSDRLVSLDIYTQG